MDIIESQTVARPVSKREYGLPRRKSTNEEIVGALLGYRYHLIGVENHVVRTVLKQFKDVFDFVDVLFDVKQNHDLLRQLGDARLLPSAMSIKEAAEVAVPLSSKTLLEARKGGRSPLSPQGINAITAYLLSQIEPRLNAVVSVVARLIQQAVLQVADAEPKIVAEIIRRLFPPSIVSKLKGGVVLSDEPPLDRIVRIVAGGTKYDNALRHRYGKLLDKARNRIAMGLLRGDSILAIKREVRGVLNKELASGAGTLARTAIQRAATQASKELYAHNNEIIKFEVWLATLDENVCLVCGHLDGRQFRLGSGPQPVDDTHPNCRCLRVPVTKSWRELGIDAKDAPAGARASMNGAIPGRITFMEWFKDQSDKVKLGILGRTRYDLYVMGEIELGDFVRNNSVLTMKQLRRKYKV